MRFSARNVASVVVLMVTLPTPARAAIFSGRRCFSGLLVVLFALFQVFASPCEASVFDFKREIIGPTPTLSVTVEEVNGTTGYVRMNGGDSAGPTIPFTWDWGDGMQGDSFFPATHTYSTTTQNYVVRVTSHYSDGTSDSVNAVIRFVAPLIDPVSLPDATRVRIPSMSTTLTSRMAGYGIPGDLVPFDDSFFGLLPRSTIEYVLSVAASVQMEFANDNVFLPDGTFQQALLRDADCSGMYSLWYTTPVSFGVSDYGFLGTVQYSSFFHEMGHNVTLNSPAGYYYGGKIDGNANAIFSESMAQIFQHATAHFVLNHLEQYGLPSDVAAEVEGSAKSSMRLVRSFYDQYLATKPFASWNDPGTPDDETLLTFMTIAYKFFEHAEEGTEGYAEPLKRMMVLLQTFDDGLRLRYDQIHDTMEADTFRATLMVAALSHGVQEDLRQEFRGLDFPIDDQTYTDLVESVNTPTSTATPTRTPSPFPTPSPTATPTVTATPTLTATQTVTATPTRTGTPSGTPTPSRTPTPTVTATRTVMPTPTVTPTPTITATRTVTPTPTVTPGAMRGDVNCDLVVNSVDALFVLQHDVGLRQCNGACAPPAGALYCSACDVNGDSNCDAIDALFILQCDVGIHNPLCPATAALPLGPAAAGDSALAEDSRATLRIRGGRVKPEDSITVLVKARVKGNVGAATLEIRYDPAVLVATACRVDTAGRFDSALCNPTFEADGVGTDAARLTAVSLTGIAGKVVLGEVTFKVVGDRPPGDRSAVEVGVMAFTDTKGAPLPTHSRAKVIRVVGRR